MSFKAVLFDMDGVVIDSEAAVTAFWEQVAGQYQVELTQDAFDTHIYGCPCRHTLDILFPRLTADQREAVLAKEKVFETDMTYTAMPGVINLLHVLQQHNIPAALVTSGERWKVEEVTKQLGMGDLFSSVVTSEDVPQGKPNPACYVLGAQRLKMMPRDCIAFEDSISGMQSAVAAGACAFGVRPERIATALFAVGARSVIPNFEQVSLERIENNILSMVGIPNFSVRFE